MHEHAVKITEAHAHSLDQKPVENKSARAHLFSTFSDRIESDRTYSTAERVRESECRAVMGAAVAGSSAAAPGAGRERRVSGHDLCALYRARRHARLD